MPHKSTSTKTQNDIGDLYCRGTKLTTSGAEAFKAALADWMNGERTSRADLLELMAVMALDENKTVAGLAPIFTRLASANQATRTESLRVIAISMQQ